MQPVQSPQAQDELHVRFWQAPHPSVLVAPMAHAGVPFSSHPSAREPLQSLQPVSQAQLPELQRECPPQLFPHDPQFATDDNRSVSHPGDPSQFAYRPVQMHARLVQLALTPHAFPQNPQLLRSASRFASHPFVHAPSQFPQFATHVHTPATHVVFAPQAFPHAPQCTTLDMMFCSQPSAGFPLQSASPGGHEHSPSAQPAPGAQL